MERTYQQRKADRENTIKIAKTEFIRLARLLAKKEQDGASNHLLVLIRGQLKVAKESYEAARLNLNNFLANDSEDEITE